MRCDMHLSVEVKENGAWASKPIQRTYDGRNYNLFAILANVRNRHDFVPISEPKGFPLDVSEEIAEEHEGNHSHSWLTLAELMAFDWTQTATLSGYVNGPEYFSWCAYRKGRGEGPDSYRQGVGGGNVKHVTVEAMEALVKKANHGVDWNDARRVVVETLSSHYCLVEWQSPYWRCASEFIGCIIPQLWRLGKPEDARIVFSFDS